MRKPLSLQLALLALWTQFWYFLIRACIGVALIVATAGAIALSTAYFTWYLG